MENKYFDGHTNEIRNRCDYEPASTAKYEQVNKGGGEKEYVVTLAKKEYLDEFYKEMENECCHDHIPSRPCQCALRRPISRNTHYYLTEEEANVLRNDPRVLGVDKVEDIVFITHGSVNNTPYTVSGNFWKDDTQGTKTISPTDRQWGHLHVAGDATQRRKSTFGPINSNNYGFSGGTVEQVTDSVDVFNGGKHVDIVICDDPISYDCEEWYSPTTNTNRFVQYQWFNELNQYVTDIDDDGETLPTGTITYYTNETNPQYHGVHVTGTAAGQYYGWAKEANIYNIAITAPWSSGQQMPGLLTFDYLRAFHRNKSVNSETGRRNPTITNHSYGSFINQPVFLNGEVFKNISVEYQGVVYNASNLNDLDVWSVREVAQKLGYNFTKFTLPFYLASVAADIQDAIEDGIVIVAAAGNNNVFIASDGDSNWGNKAYNLQGNTFYTNRGSSPGTPDSGAIVVGALSVDKDFLRSRYTNYGNGIDIFAPGDNIVSSYNSEGLSDSKYTLGSGNYFYPISGTSMASPQVCGIAACLASGKPRFTQEDLRGYLNKYSTSNDMAFNVDSISAMKRDVSIEVKTSESGTQGRFHFANQDYNSEDDGYFFRDNSALIKNAPNPTITMQVGDFLEIYDNADYFGYAGDWYTDGSGSTGPRNIREPLIFQLATTAKSTSTSIGTEILYNVSFGNVGGTAQSPRYCDREGNYSGSGNSQKYILQVGDVIDIVPNGPFHTTFSFKTTPTGAALTTGVSKNTDPSELHSLWDTSGYSAGTYYFVSDDYPSAYGEIELVASGTYVDKTTHQFFVKTALGPGSTNAILNKNILDPANYDPANDVVVSFHSSNGIEFTSFRPNAVGTYYIQSDTYPNVYATINVVASEDISGTHSDRTCQQGSPNKVLHIENPRPDFGNVQGVKGQRKDNGQVFPRNNLLN